MSNMSYCRFQNTLNDLQDCYENFSEEVSKDEDRARKRLIRLCQHIAEDFGDEYGEDN